MRERRRLRVKQGRQSTYLMSPVESGTVRASLLEGVSV